MRLRTAASGTHVASRSARSAFTLHSSPNHKRNAAGGGVVADQLVRFLDFFQRESLRDDRRDALLAHELERLRDLGGGDVARGVQLQTAVQEIPGIKHEARV